MAELRVLENPESDSALQQSMVEMIREVLVWAERGDLAGIVMVPIKADLSFKMLKAGTIRRLQTVGYLAQAQNDLLNAEEPG